MKNTKLLCLSGVVSAVASSALAIPRTTATSPVLPPTEEAFGKSLNDWLYDYWEWYLTGGSAATQPYTPGPNPIVFMPLPSGEYESGAAGTSRDPAILVGNLEVNLKPESAFVLPLFVWIAETYNTGQANDPLISAGKVRSTVRNADDSGVPEVTLDGIPILVNFWEYYGGPTRFDPIVTYAEPSSYGSVGAVAFQSVGFVANPLPPGTHTIHLVERLLITNEDLPGYPLPIDYGVIYDNTWTIHVQN